ncbi:MAG: xylulokinase [Oscillospiraceae bacterium]|nr:xylulokinase [Oscillospiraceae bacterium]
MANGYLLAHDLGTSGNKATLYDTNGRLVGSAVYAYDTMYPHSRWVEQDPEDWWKAVCVTTRTLLQEAAAKASDILCVSFSAQMMGCLLVDKQGSPLRPMITWADSRAWAEEDWMQARVGAERGYHITGHRLSASYSAAKLLWVRAHEPDVYRRADKMIHAKDYIVFRLTGRLVTDFSDASGTNLLDIQKKMWSEELISAFELRRDLLPELHPSTDVAGRVTAEAARACGLLEGTPVVIGGGDGSCACVGAGVVKEGRAYNVIGTSSWISSAARQPYFDPQMRTFNWVHLDPTLYTPCGTMQAAGLSYQWYKNTLCGGEAAQAERTGRSVYALLDEAAAAARPGAGGVLYLPYLIGERSPQWNLNARGAFVGLHASTQKGDLSRAVLEGVGCNLRIILEAFAATQTLDNIIMIGGGAKGRTWLRILADIWQRTLLVPAYIEEATSLGAAVCGGVGIGLFKDFEACRAFNPIVDEIRPNPAHKTVYDTLFSFFQQTYDQLVPVYDRLADARELHRPGGAETGGAL